TLVVGFRVAEANNAVFLLDALASMVQMIGLQVDEAKPFIQRLKSMELENGKAMTISLDTDLIPMEELDEDQREIAAKVIELLEGRSVSFAMGVKDGVLLTVFSENKSAIGQVMARENNLLSHPKLAVLRNADTSRLRSVNYVSKEFKESQWNANFSGYFQRMSGQVQMAMKSSDENGQLQSLAEEIETDARWLDEKLASAGGTFGETLTWSVATDKGSEGYSYDWSSNKLLQNAVPLSLLDHAGDSPLLMFALKQNENEIAKQMVEYVLGRIPEYVRQGIELSEQDESKKAEALDLFGRAWPLVVDAYEILRDKVAPSMSGNESLFVFSGLWSTDTLGPNAPPPSGPLPLPEFAIASSMDNRDMFINGCSELYGVFDRVVELVREVNPNAVPADYEIPRPVKASIEGGSSYTYEQLAASVPLEGFNPQVAVTDQVLVIGYSQRQVDSMLRAKKLRAMPAWITPSTPVAAFGYADMAGIVQTIRPWIEFGLSVTNPDLDQPLAPGPGPIPTGNDVLRIWDCFTSMGKAASTVTVSDSGPTVGRWVWVSE
ncbi:MAG: hypothetical protein KDA87_26790, partial [Planctomycetales bacterium]|nr:hypothetical protein [Planctomycetales bacterium]